MKKKNNEKQNENNFGKGKCKFSHFTLEERKQLEELVCSRLKIKEIATILHKSETSVSRELKRNRSKVYNHRKPNHCVLVKECVIKSLCKNMACRTLCKNCFYGKNCNSKCDAYIEAECPKLNRFPYVCNGCSLKRNCTCNFYNYDVTSADKTSKLVNSESRKGIGLSEEEFKKLDSLLVNGTKKGQSVEHICSYCEFNVGSRTVRNYINHGYTTVTNLETPRGVKFKKRKKKVPADEIKKTRSCKVGRDYSSFLRYMTGAVFTIYTQLDTVEGLKKDGKKPLLLTLIIVKLNLFLCFLIPDSSSKRKKEVFDYLYNKLGNDYSKFFKVILTDNGSEFNSPEDIEIDFETGEVRSKVFYCSPYHSWEKGSIEVCHELLRRIIPKGQSLRHLTTLDTVLINNVINNYVRVDLDNKSAYQLFCDTFPENGEKILKKLKIRYLEPDLIDLTPSLFLNTELKNRMKDY